MDNLFDLVLVLSHPAASSRPPVTKDDIQNHFKEAAGTIAEVKLMNGFGFIEYEDAMDARDVVPNGSDLNGSRLTVQFARGSRQRDFPGPPERPHPRPRRTAHRMQITGLPAETSWQDLKDFARRSGLDVVYSEVGRDRDGKGFVEFETAADLKVAVEKLDTNDFKGATVRCVADTDPSSSLKTTSPVTIATAVLTRRLPGVVLTQQMDTTRTVVPLHLANILLAFAMSIVAVVPHLVTTSTMAATSATDLLRLCAPVVVHLLRIPTHLHVVAMIPMPLRRLDVRTKILMRRMGIVGHGSEAHRGVMAGTKIAHVI
ncbi:MAG: hypothetical protein Q9211_003354, partial [Gyalolechia sp. 1 TL-2023]